MLGLQPTQGPHSGPQFWPWDRSNLGSPLLLGFVAQLRQQQPNVRRGRYRIYLGEEEEGNLSTPLEVRCCIKTANFIMTTQSDLSFITSFGNTFPVLSCMVVMPAQC